MIAIINYGMGNLGSVANMLKKLGFKAQITNEKEIIEKSDKLILPGVGAFKLGMEKLAELDFIEFLKYQVFEKKKKILGICLGMQLMTQWSEEGNVPGLGWFDAETLRFDLDTKKYKIPHMGWNTIQIVSSSPLFENCKEEPRFYFVHSYYVKNNNSDDILAYSEHGIKFTAAMGKDNIFATQFHPEKSHKFGMNILNNFARL
jgi:glutamine amidotransferase